MTLRRSLAALLAVILGSPTVAFAANYTTTNFSVDAPTPELAKKFGEWAEFYREQKAVQWLGKEMPPWRERCPLRIQISMGSAGGATTFTFGYEGGRPVVTSQQMEIRGEARQLQNSVLPHEITHTVLAYHFGRAVPRWADEGGSVLSENDEERFSHDVRCRELLNAGRGIRLRVLFRMAEYPRDMMVLYAQGYSICAYLVEKGGPNGRAKLLEFVGLGMHGSDPRSHGTPESWNEAARKVYGFETVDAMEEAWLQALKAPPSRVAAREAGNTGSTKTSAVASTAATPANAMPSAIVASGGKTELRATATPVLPMLEPPVRARGAAPDFEPTRPTYLPPANPTNNTLPAQPVSHPQTPLSRPVADIPPPVLLPPEIPLPAVRP
jgi:hypothetical protein